MVMVYFLCAIIFAAPAAVSAVAVDGQSRVIRRENGGSVQLGAGGEMVHVEDKSASGLELGTDQAKATVEDNTFCDNDYPKGEYKTNKCITPAGEPYNHTMILQQSACEDAARLAFASGSDRHWIIDEALYPHRPWGCFADHCSACHNINHDAIATSTGEASRVGACQSHTGSNDMCYFFNGANVEPNDIQEGTIICKRKLFVNGTQGGIPGDVHNGCPFNYQPVMDKKTCEDAGGCFPGMAVATEILVGVKNASEHDDHPIGCFINLLDNRVYYNYVETSFETPQHPAPWDVPICTVTSRTTWP